MAPRHAVSVHHGPRRAVSVERDTLLCERSEI